MARLNPRRCVSESVSSDALTHWRICDRCNCAVISYEELRVIRKTAGCAGGYHGGPMNYRCH